MTRIIDATQHDEVKRLVGQCVPTIKSSHRAEAVARGLGFGSNAALRAALAQGPATVEVDRLSFEAFLADRGRAPASLQVALLPDALRLAVGADWLPIDTHGVRWRACMSCLDGFMSSGPSNRVCSECKVRDGRMPGVHHAPKVLYDIFEDVFRHGAAALARWKRLRVRPGWPDILDGADFQEEVNTWLLGRDAVRSGRMDDLPRIVAAQLGPDIHLAKFT